MSFPVTFSYIERLDARGHIFWEDLHNYARIVSRRTTIFGKATHAKKGRICRGQHAPTYAQLRRTTIFEFGRVTHVGKGCVSKGSEKAHPKGRSSSVPEFL